MIAFLLRRIARMVVSLIVVLVASFAMIHMIPGDPVRAALGPNAPVEMVEERRTDLGLDKPLPQQFFAYVDGLIHADLGTSILSLEPVGRVIADRLPNTLALTLLSVTCALLVGVPLGMWLGARTENGRNRGSELAFTTVTGAILAVPEFVMAIAFVVVFAVTWNLLPPAGKDGPESFILPVTVLALGPAALIARLVRLETLRVLSQDYIRLARAKRLRPARIYLRHVLPNTLTATLTIAGLLLSGSIAGSVLVETVFAWPGMGSRVVESILNKDYPVAQAIMLLYGTAVLVVNFAVDLLLGVIDPRSAIRNS